MAFESVQDITKAYEAFYIVDEAQTKVFNLDECEHCGCQVQAPNATLLVKNPIFMTPLNTLLAKAGLQEFTEELDELGWCDELDMAVCTDCWIPDGK